ncbi:hypothetical protein [Lyngbya aestuarii]|uniref:hypothetical protein n=1 Tax=Lyngbya aestuarii TaxID=118322 RepID=UPI00403D9C59
MTIFYDLNFGSVHQLFDESGKIIDEATYVRRFDRFMQEMVWMSTVLQYGRQNVSIDKQKDEGTKTFHANKPCPEMAAKMGSNSAGTVLEVKTCSETGKIEATPVTT